MHSINITIITNTTIISATLNKCVVILRNYIHILRAFGLSNLA